ncbi:hypothetical protein FPZ49_20355 [Paenibacillus cremeus]|uniref:Uncharacterized protein n=2 Tax=Paenibacillus cremeus TaxID=2163881 RepID=A0A559K7K4_9BACL|nr:hypothetical protein FPZ49_20355 [Paenibacillus cremeus]
MKSIDNRRGNHEDGTFPVWGCLQTAYFVSGSHSGEAPFMNVLIILNIQNILTNVQSSPASAEYSVLNGRRRGGRQAMSKFFGYVGGLIGSIALSNVSVGMFGWKIFSMLDIVFAIVSLLGLIVFSGALLYEGVKTFFGKES